MTNPQAPRSDLGRRLRSRATTVAMTLAGIAIAFAGAAGSDMQSVAAAGPSKTVRTTTTTTTTTAWPGPSNTGVPVGTVLTPHAGDVSTTMAGQVIDSLDVAGGILVRNDNVTIERVRITASPTASSPIGIRIMDGVTGTVIEDSTIDMSDAASSIGVGYANYTILRSNIYGAMKSIQIGDHVTAQDNWVHDPYTGGTSHTEDVAIFGSATPTQSVIRHNTLSNPHSQTATVFIKTDQGPVNGVVVDDNYLDGGNYSVYSVIGYWDHKTAPQNVSITNNVFTRTFTYGPLDVDGTAVITGNTYSDGTPIH